MKTIFKQTTLLALIISLLLSACKKDKDDAGSADNSYTYQNGGNPKTEKIAKAAYLPEGNEMRLLLYNSSNANDGIEVYLETAGSALTTIPEGSFTNAPNTIAFRSAILYYNDGDKSYAVSSIGRKISIAKNGDNYKIDFEFTSDMGLVRGSYNGPAVRAQ